MEFFSKLIDIQYKSGMGISGMTDEFFCLYLSCLLEKEKKSILVVVNSLYEANNLYSSLQNYNNNNVYLFPMDDFLTSEAIAISPDLKISRLETINSIMNSKKAIVITNIMGYLRFLPTKSRYSSSIINLSLKQEISPKKLVEKLTMLGYKKESIVTTTGEVGVRGYVIDLFPLGFDYPVRIEFFGDEIDSIRTFDPNSQKSISKLSEVDIYPFTEFITDKTISEDHYEKQKYLPLYEKNIANISDYLDDFISVYKDYHQLKVSYSVILEQMMTFKNEKDIDFVGKYMYDFYNINPKNTLYYMSLNNSSSILKKENILKYDVKTITKFNENEELIVSFLRNNISKGKTVFLCLNKDANIRAIRKINFPINEVKNEYKENKVNLINVGINEGFIYKNYIFISEKELFNHNIDNKKYKTRFKYSAKLKDINSLKIGDYVVHNSHGIGIYNGIRVLETSGVKRDYIEVLYQGKDKLYIPVEKIDLLYKYVGKEGSVPKVNKMDGVDWKKTKSRVKSRVADMADRLLKIYAERENNKGFAFSQDNHLQNQFENDCGFELTPDQAIAVKQTKDDMEKSVPMDRLLCGDVGFGKTEVAFRACFKAILDSKQVLFLCPTTILSNQHYENALKRFKNFPVNIELLNRFTSTSRIKKIVQGLKDGTVDLVFGTHRLLSNDIKPKDLGLLVIDEEQRFGVLHKEKIKEFKSTVDVLTLTATPIPRTLQMSMTGIRSLSLIETPPINRYPIQTNVVEENQQLIKDAIYKEISRKGQVFILYNSVEKIERKVDEIKRLVPDALVNYAHGRMTKTELENRMLSFINHEYDILVCTTIIETGIDIPNVNTLIILDSDRFGLSQLYQIRGRVGRSDKFAYAYLMYNSSKVLTETAIKRLNVIKEFTELGSGFSIATRDLSIRGAGDILGSEQAGFIDTVGIDLYLKLLDQEVAKRRGENVNEDEEEKQPVLNVATHIDDKYVDDESLKIEIHKKINEIDSKEKLDEVKNELEDRFGKINEDILIYMYEEWFEKQIDSIGIKNVRQTRNSIELIFDKEVIKQLDTEELFVKSFEISNMFRFKSIGTNLVIILDTIRLQKHPLFYLTNLLDYINKYLKNIDLN